MNEHIIPHQIYNVSLVYLFLTVVEPEDLPGVWVGQVPGLRLTVQVLYQARAVTFLTD